MARLLTAIILLVTVCSCLSDHTERMEDTPSTGWYPGDTIVLPYINSDTLSPRTLSLIFKADRQPHPSLFDIEMNIMGPDSLTTKHMVTVNLDTKPRRTIFHYLYEAPFDSPQVFEKSGLYLFYIFPSRHKVEGVVSAGIKVTPN